jgi:hypothetical protein
VEFGAVEADVFGDQFVGDDGFDGLLELGAEAGGVGGEEEFFVGQDFVGEALAADFIDDIEAAGDVGEGGGDVFEVGIEVAAEVEAAGGFGDPGIAGVGFLQFFDGELLDFRVAVRIFSRMGGQQAEGDGGALAGADDLGDGGEDFLVGEFRGRRAGDAQGFARHGVGEA